VHRLSHTVRGVQHFLARRMDDGFVTMAGSGSMHMRWGGLVVAAACWP
jgi:predicted small integral membrane protein